MENTTMIAMSSEGAPKKEHEHMRRHHLHYGTINWEIVIAIILCLYSFGLGYTPYSVYWHLPFILFRSLFCVQFFSFSFFAM